MATPADCCRSHTVALPSIRLHSLSCFPPRQSHQVEGSDAEPYILLRSRTGAVLSKDDPCASYEWYRSHCVAACIHSKCPLSASDLVGGSRGAVQCVPCLQRGVPSALSFFCSAACLKAAWPSHREYHLRFGVTNDHPLPPSYMQSPAAKPFLTAIGATGAGAGVCVCVLCVCVCVCCLLGVYAVWGYGVRGCVSV